MRAGEFIESRCRALISGARKSFLAVREGVDPEALHDFRVHVRRLRAVLRTIAPPYYEYPSGTIGKLLGSLARSTGEIRDREVFLELLLGLDDSVISGPRRSALYTTEKQIYQEKMREFLRYAESADIFHPFTLLESMLRLPVDPDLDGPAGRFAEQIAQKNIQDLDKKMKKLKAALSSPEKLHKLRIQAKRTRYVIDFYADLLPGRLLQSDRARHIQNLTGRVQDCAVLSGYLDSILLGVEEKVLLFGHIEAQREEALRALSAL